MILSGTSTTVLFKVLQQGMNFTTQFLTLTYQRTDSFKQWMSHSVFVDRTPKNIRVKSEATKCIPYLMYSVANRSQSPPHAR